MGLPQCDSSLLQYVACWPLYAACLEQYCIAVGETHPDTLSSMNNLLTVLYFNQGQHAKAESIYLLKGEVVLGAGHPDTIRTRNNLD